MILLVASKPRPLASTAQAMRASLLASAIASTTPCTAALSSELGGDTLARSFPALSSLRSARATCSRRRSMSMPATSSDQWRFSARTRSIEPRYQYPGHRCLEESGGQRPTLAGLGGQIAHCGPGMDGPIRAVGGVLLYRPSKAAFLETGVMGWAAMTGGLWRGSRHRSG